MATNSEIEIKTAIEERIVRKIDAGRMKDDDASLDGEDVKGQEQIQGPISSKAEQKSSFRRCIGF